MVRNGTTVISGGSGFRRSLRTLLAACAVVMAAGCYVYVPARPGTVSPGSDVRIRVDRNVDLSVGEVPLPLSGSHTVRGQLVQESTPDTLMCSVLLQPFGIESGASGLRGVVSIPADAVEMLEVRHLATTRTVAVAAAGVALGVSLVGWAFDIHNAREGTDPTPGVDNARITLLRLRW